MPIPEEDISPVVEQASTHDAETANKPEKKQKLRNEWILKRPTLKAAAQAVVRRMEELQRKVDAKGSEHRLHIKDLQKLKEISPSPERIDRLIELVAAERLRSLLVYRVLGVLMEGGITATNLASGGNTDIAKYSFILGSTGIQLDTEEGQGNLQKLIGHELRAILEEISVRYNFEQNKGIIPDFSTYTAKQAADSVAETEEVYPFITQIAPSVATQLSILTVSGHEGLAGIYFSALAVMTGLKRMRSLHHLSFLQTVRNKILEGTVPFAIQSVGEIDALEQYKPVYLPVYYLLLRYMPNLSKEGEVEESAQFMQSVRAAVEALQLHNTTLCTPEEVSVVSS